MALEIWRIAADVGVLLLLFPELFEHWKKWKGHKLLFETADILTGLATGITSFACLRF